MPTLYVVAGPNGCGKSTLTRTGWLRDLDIIDPDAIARTAAFAMLAAAVREALRRRRAALRAGRTHVLETTLAGSGVFRHMEATRAAGLRVELHYVCVKLPELALDRIEPALRLAATTSRTRTCAGGLCGRRPTCRQPSSGSTKYAATTTPTPTGPIKTLR